MKKNILETLLGFSTASFSTDIELMSDLNNSIRKNPVIVAYIKDIINTPNKDIIIKDIINPDENHHGLNFNEILQQTFGENCWVPQDINFNSSKVENILTKYRRLTQDIDIYHIFMANILYDCGEKYYRVTEKPEFLEYAAFIGHPEAQYLMFLISLKTKKFSETKNYILSAASQKNPDALLKLSEIYQGGYQYLSKDFIRDLEISREFCNEAAILGNKDAEFRMEVATLTEGFFGAKIDYQKGVLRAQELVKTGNKRAKKFINAIMNSSADSIMEGNNSITQNDIDFLKENLNWQDE